MFFKIKKNFQKIYSYLILLFLIIFFILKFLDYFKEDPRLNYRYTYWSSPIAISHIIGNEKDYTGYGSVRNFITNESHGYNKKKLNSLFNKALSSEIKDPHSVRVSSDDLGIVDLTILAFRIFGVEKDSVDFFIIFLIFISAILFYLQFRNFSEFKIILFIYLFTLLLFFNSFLFESGGIYFSRLNDPRFFSIIGFIPLIHSYFFIKKKFIKNQNRDFNNTNTLFFLIQIYIFGILCFSRSSLKLDLIFSLSLLLIIFIFILLFQKTHTKIVLGKIQILIFGSLLSAIILTPNIIKSFVINENHYPGSSNMSSHPVYGMLRAGLMIDNLKLSQKYYFDMSHGNIDMALANSLKYFNEELSVKEEKDLFYKNNSINWDISEKAEKKFYFYLLYQETNEVLKTYFIYKPLKIYNSYLRELKSNEDSKIIWIIMFMVILIIGFYEKAISPKTLFEVSLLAISPVIIKNILFWGLQNYYFLDFYILFNFVLILFLYYFLSLFFRLIAK